jgi:hypothetical protein
MTNVKNPDNWPFPSAPLEGGSTLKTLAETLSMLEDFTAFQLRGDIYYGYPDKKALSTIEGLRSALGTEEALKDA